VFASALSKFLESGKVTSLLKENSMSALRLQAALCVSMVLWCATPALAADRTDARTEAQAAYTRDRAECLARQDREDRAVCLREVGAAFQESKRGALTDRQAQFDQNRLARCDNQPLKDRDECVRRMNQGTTSGSVQSGVVIRELKTPVVPAK
jgi:hypothetical protein